MTVLYADTSALISAYFADESDHASLEERLLEGSDPVVTSEITRLEFAGAVATAVRTGRLRGAQIVLRRFDADCGVDGPLTLLRLRPDPTLEIAYQLVLQHSLRTLDAIHLAVATTEAVALSEGVPVILVTRDIAQATVARTLGIATG